MFLKEKVDFKNLLKVAISFEVISILLFNLILYITKGGFYTFNSLPEYLIIGIYLVLQGLLVAYLGANLRGFLVSSKIKAGLFAGLTMWFLNHALAVFVGWSYLATNYQLLSVNWLKLQTTLLVIVGGVLYLLDLLVMGWVLIFLVDKFYHFD